MPAKTAVISNLQNKIPVKLICFRVYLYVTVDCPVDHMTRLLLIFNL